MFSYRHIFHAGNHADVLKHIILIDLLDHLLKKNKSFIYIDTHAGAGSYPLQNLKSNINKETKNGIEILLNSTSPKPDLIEKYLEIIKIYWTSKNSSYPGSPLIALEKLRPQDRINLCEWHPSDAKILKTNPDCKNISHQKNIKISVSQENGFQFLKSLLPPKQKRGLILIDPSYEDKSDYKNIENTLLEGLRRFATGIFAIWYPLIARKEAYFLPFRLASISPSSWIHVTLNIKATPTGCSTPKIFEEPVLYQDLGTNNQKKQKSVYSSFYGSGMFIINPPYTLKKNLEKTLPYLSKILAQDQKAGFFIEENSK